MRPLAFLLSWYCKSLYVHIRPILIACKVIEDKVSFCDY